jgi:superfamily II DNA/RNA helicase
VNIEDDEEEEHPPFLVTFEGSARGLHFDAVDAVFIVGRPVSAASYLHLAGRVGRSSADDGSVVIRPGTVVSLCTKGSATELAKWTRQIGGTDLEELVL